MDEVRIEHLDARLSVVEERVDEILRTMRSRRFDNRGDDERLDSGMDVGTALASALQNIGGEIRRARRERDDPTK